MVLDSTAMSGPGGIPSASLKAKCAFSNSSLAGDCLLRFRCGANFRRTKLRSARLGIGGARDCGMRRIAPDAFGERRSLQRDGNL